MTLRQPVGPILSIVPWNGTAVLAARAIAYPLVCGNTVVFKGSEFSPATHALITQCVQEAGLPAGVLNYLNSSPDRSPEIADALISAKEIRRINFTGSTAWAALSRRRPRNTSSAAYWSSAASPRLLFWMTQTLTRRSRQRCSVASCSKVRSACPLSAWC